MKKLTLVIFLLSATLASVNAQTKNKFGHINSQDLLEKMPEKDAADNQLKEFGLQLQKQMENMGAEYDRLVADYVENKDSWTDIIRQTKEEEIGTLEQRIQSFQQNAQQSMAKKEAELYQPILDKARKAIEEVAKENAFTYIFDVSSGSLLYQPESDDIYSLVAPKLGITE